MAIETAAPSRTYTLMGDYERHLLTSADLAEAVAAGRKALEEEQVVTAVLFDDATGKRTELELLAHPTAVAARLGLPEAVEASRAGPGRPKLGVVSREVSLLPRHWEWLGAQSGGASAALRRLVEREMLRTQSREGARRSRDAAYQAMSVLAGERPGFEEVCRALYRNEFDRVRELVRAIDWPEGVVTYALQQVETAARWAALAAQEAEAPS